MTGKVIKTKKNKYTFIKCKNPKEAIASWRGLLDKTGAFLQMTTPTSFVIVEVR
jgi:hypothetical protein